MLIAVSYRESLRSVTRVKVKCASLKAGAPFRIDHRGVSDPFPCDGAIPVVTTPAFGHPSGGGELSHAGLM
ncbi:MAG TPA: hypothetical protein PKW59_10735 [Thermotogota bacterium]|nr:hypothetical protein [Thermotogota bacterium]